MRQTSAWLMVEVFMKEELRFVSGDSGAQCVMISGTIEMLQWCVDNLVIMEVSQNKIYIFTLLLVWLYHVHSFLCFT